MYVCVFVCVCVCVCVCMCVFKNAYIYADCIKLDNTDAHCKKHFVLNVCSIFLMLVILFVMICSIKIVKQ